MKEPAQPITRLGMPARCPDCGAKYLSEFDARHIVGWLEKLGDETLAEVIARATELRA